jgi:tetratricopeptide (TPR) repeat protein
MNTPWKKVDIVLRSYKDGLCNLVVGNCRMNSKVREFRILSLCLIFLAVILPASYAQTNLPMASPESLAKLVNSRVEIERCIILATPNSLQQAQEAVAQSKMITENEKTALLAIIRGVSTILYPVYSPTPLGFFIDSSLPGIKKNDALCLAQLVEASQGRIFARPNGEESSFLTEILPALAIFKSEDAEVSRKSLEYIDRFEATGAYRSAIPGLVRSRAAKNAGDLQNAYTWNRILLGAFPDVWPARLDVGIISLALGQPVPALSFLAPLAEQLKDNPVFLEAYGTALYRNTRFDQAEPIISKALEANPGNIDLALIEAHLLIDRNNYIRAQPLLEAYGRKKPTDRMYIYLRALLARGLERREESLRWARRALQGNPQDPELMVLVSGILFSGPASGHAEAVLLAEEAKKLFAQARAKGSFSEGIASTPLLVAMREEAEGEATRYLLLDAYKRQDWYTAAGLLDTHETQTLDKAVVATILRKAGKTDEAIAFSSEWFAKSPGSEAAAEAYLRALSAKASGTGLAALGSGNSSDAASGLIAMIQSAGTNQEQPTIISLVLQLLSGSYSSRMRSYLQYLRGTYQTDQSAAIDSYRTALLERPDNIEAILALAKIYRDKGDIQKAQFYIRQARLVGITDKDLEKALLEVEKTLSAE